MQTYFVFTDSAKKCLIVKMLFQIIIHNIILSPLIKTLKFKPEFTIVNFIHYKPRISSQFPSYIGWR